MTPNSHRPTNKLFLLASLQASTIVFTQQYVEHRTNTPYHLSSTLSMLSLIHPLIANGGALPGIHRHEFDVFTPKNR